MAADHPNPLPCLRTVTTRILRGKIQRVFWPPENIGRSHRPAKIFKNSACDQRNHDALCPKLPYSFTDVRVENIVLGDRAIEIESHETDVAVLESDVLRQVLTARPHYDEEERETFFRQMVYIGKLLTQHGVPVIFDATANRRRYRDPAREQIPRFMEV